MPRFSKLTCRMATAFSLFNLVSVGERRQRQRLAQHGDALRAALMNDAAFADPAELHLITLCGREQRARLLQLIGGPGVNISRRAKAFPAY